MSNRSLAIVGAGVAGLGGAYALSGSDVDVTVFEATDRLGGRVVTRRRGDYRYDTGANYITPADGRMEATLASLGTDGLVDVDQPVWTFTADGEITEGDPDRQDDHKWTYESGIQEFASRVAERIDATVRLDTTVDHLRRRRDGWEIIDPTGVRVSRAEAVLLTPPAPKTARILAWSEWDDDRLRSLYEAADGVTYRVIVTVVLGYSVELADPFYALLNTDREHSVGWLSREECKSGHVPDGESVLVAQMAPGWSERYFDATPDQLAAAAAAHAADLLDDERLREPGWTDVDRFVTALPDDAIPADTREAAEPEGLFIAGDAVVGEGRVSRAFFTGVDAGRRIDATL